MSLIGRYGITGRRSLEIAVRTSHIAAMAFLAGGQASGAPPPSLRGWALLTALTGAALLGTEASHSRHWVFQVRGVLSLVHVGVFAVVAVAPRIAPVAFAAALVVGSIGSHLPRVVRKWSLRHRRVVD